MSVVAVVPPGAAADTLAETVRRAELATPAGISVDLEHGGRDRRAPTLSGFEQQGGSAGAAAPFVITER